MSHIPSTRGISVNEPRIEVYEGIVDNEDTEDSEEIGHPSSNPFSVSTNPFSATCNAEFTFNAPSGSQFHPNPLFGTTQDLGNTSPLRSSRVFLQGPAPPQVSQSTVQVDSSGVMGLASVPYNLPEISYDGVHLSSTHSQLSVPPSHSNLGPTYGAASIPTVTGSLPPAVTSLMGAAFVGQPPTASFPRASMPISMQQFSPQTYQSIQPVGGNGIPQLPNVSSTPGAQYLSQSGIANSYAQFPNFPTGQPTSLQPPISSLVYQTPGPNPGPTIQYDALARALLTQMIPGGNHGAQRPRETTSSKFKMNIAKVPEVMLKGGEWLTPDGVLRWVSSACTLDDAAIRACNRTPVTVHEWREFFRFYLLHFEGILGQYVSFMLDHQEIMSVNAFWLLVFKKVFPPGMIYQAFSQALQLYPMWAEAGGLDRWD